MFYIEGAILHVYPSIQNLMKNLTSQTMSHSIYSDTVAHLELLTHQFAHMSRYDVEFPWVSGVLF